MKKNRNLIHIVYIILLFILILFFLINDKVYNKFSDRYLLNSAECIYNYSNKDFNLRHEDFKNKHLHSFAIYPSFIFSDKNITGLNSFIENREKDFVYSFTETNKEVPYSEGDLFINSEVFKNYFFNDKVFSVVFDYTGYSGGEHELRYSTVINYDLELGKELSIRDIFKSNDYLKIMSDYFLNYYKNNNEFEENWLKRGLEPSNENFDSFSFIKDGLLIYFPPYQINSYGKGEVIGFIPSSELISELKDRYIFK